MNGPHHPTITPKFQVVLTGIGTGQSKIKAIQALASFLHEDLKTAKYIVAHMPVPLCVMGCETFDSLVLDETELAFAQATLQPLFEMEIQTASKQVLPFGNFGIGDYIPATA